MSVRSVVSSSRTNVIWYVLSRVLSKASAILLLPLYTRLLPPHELGLVLVALAAGGALSLVVAPGIEAVYLRWVYREGRGSGPAAGTVTLLHLAMTAAALAVLAAAAAPICSVLLPGVPVWPFYGLIVINAVLVSLAAPLRAKWRAERRADKVAGMEVAQWFVSLVTVVTALFVFRWGAVSLLAGETASGLFMLPFAAGRLVGNVRWGWDAALYRTVLPLAASGLPLTASIWALSSLDRLLLNWISGPEAVALYGVAYQIGAAVMLVSVILDKEWEVVVFDFAKPDTVTGGSAEVLQGLWSLSLSLFMVLASFVALFSNEIVRWGLGPQYAASARLIPWVVVVAVLKVPFSLMIHLARARNRPEAVTIGSVLAVVVFVIGNLVLIPRWGPLGAVWAGIGGYASACLFWFSRQWNCFHMERGVTGWALVAGAAVLLGSLMGGTMVSRLAGSVIVGRLVYQAVSYWKFLGRIYPVGAGA
jgi:O-antigen/teichoic acid export membrane protein